MMHASNQQPAKPQESHKRNNCRRKPSKSSLGPSLMEMLTNLSKCKHDPSMACSHSGSAPSGEVGGALKTMATASSQPSNNKSTISLKQPATALFAPPSRSEPDHSTQHTNNKLVENVHSVCKNGSKSSLKRLFFAMSTFALFKLTRAACTMFNPVT